MLYIRTKMFRIRQANRTKCDKNRTRRKRKDLERLEFYKACVKKHTTTFQTVEEIHSLGREEVIMVLLLLQLETQKLRRGETERNHSKSLETLNAKTFIKRMDFRFLK